MRITHDLFDIVWELGRIDPSYRVEYREGAFWLASERGMQMRLPYPKLDMRTVRHVRKTRVERAEALMEELERENAAAQRAALHAAQRQAETRAERVLQKGGGDGRS